MLTRERVRNLLTYYPNTGRFRWRVTLQNGRQVGDLAGLIGRKGYHSIGIDGHRYQSHRLAWLIVHGRWPIAEIDHINNNKADNRIANLREATRAENACNMVGPNTYKGVTYHTQTRKFQAQIKKHGKNKYLGLFATAEEASRAYCTAATELHGEFANLGSVGRKSLREASIPHPRPENALRASPGALRGLLTGEAPTPNPRRGP